MPRPVQPRGCKGRSPLHKKTKNLPLPAGKGAGGIGAGKQVKAGLTGDKAGTPPAGTTVAGQAGDKAGTPPRRAPQWQGRQATKQARPPPGTADARRAGNAEASRPTGAHIPHTAELTPYFYRKTIAIGKNMW